MSKYGHTRIYHILLRQLIQYIDLEGVASLSLKRGHIFGQIFLGQSEQNTVDIETNVRDTLTKRN